MKNPLILLVLSLGVACADPALNANTHYLNGIASENAGDPTAAGEAYKTALKLNPNHANARFRLGQLKINSAAIAAKGREAKIGGVMLPEIHLEDASLRECLDALAIKIEKESNGEVTPNFIIQDPSGKLAEAKVSFQLKNVPTSSALRYILTQSRAKVRYDEHAVVVSPK
jgi:tetratricopeptide (TPR) repeat protein